MEDMLERFGKQFIPLRLAHGDIRSSWSSPSRVESDTLPVGVGIFGLFPANLSLELNHLQAETFVDTAKPIVGDQVPLNEFTDY